MRGSQAAGPEPLHLLESDAVEQPISARDLSLQERESIADLRSHGARPKDSRLAEHGELHDYVKTRLLRHWSPEQISKLLTKEFPDDGQMRVGTETIYQTLYFQARGGLKREIKETLRTGLTRLKQHRNPEERTSRFRDPMINTVRRATY